ncbi:MAG: outer membrane protein transport protein [Gemmatimonadota bacterium]
MENRWWWRALGSTVFALTLAGPASATDGHFLHGVGAVNSAMGGAGIAAPGDLMGSMYLNPAGLTTIDGTRVAFGFEMFKPSRTVSSSMPGLGAGSTESKSNFVPIPSFGFSMKAGERWTVAVAGLGIGGFGVDYPSSTANPILANRPNGFGQVYSNFSLMKIMPAAAVQASDRLSLGFALNLDWASLTVDPMPTASPVVAQTPQGPAPFYSRASAGDGQFGFGLQAGLLYQATDALTFGLAYTSPQWFKDFTFNAMDENPFSSGYGSAREIVFAMDVPAVYGAGVALQPSETVLLTGDVRYITYSSTAGFETDSPGFQADGSVDGFGWDDILVGAAGVEIAASSHWKLRAGYNYSQNPIPDDLSVYNVAAPAVVQHHLTAGLGFQNGGGFGVDLGLYQALANDITGPFNTPFGVMEVTNELSETSVLLQFSFSGLGR